MTQFHKYIQVSRFRISLCLLTAMFISSALSGQNISATVINSISGQAVPYAEIKLSSLADSNNTLTFVSDILGNYSGVLLNDSLPDLTEYYTSGGFYYVYRSENDIIIRLTGKQIDLCQNALIFDLRGSILAVAKVMRNGNSVEYRIEQSLFVNQTVIVHAKQFRAIITQNGQGVQFNQPWTAGRAQHTTHKKVATTAFEDFLFESNNLDSLYQPYSEIFSLDVDGENSVSNYLNPWPTFLAELTEEIQTETGTGIPNAWSVFSQLNGNIVDSLTTDANGEITRIFDVPNWSQDRLLADTLRFAREIGATGYHMHRDTIDITNGSYEYTIQLQEQENLFPHRVQGQITSPYKLLRITADGQVVHTQNTGTSFDVNFENEEATTDVNYYLEHDDLHDTLNTIENVEAEDLNNTLFINKVRGAYNISGNGNNTAPVILSHGQYKDTAYVNEGVFNFGRVVLNSVGNADITLLSYLEGFETKNIAQNVNEGATSIDMTLTPVTQTFPHQVQGTLSGPYSQFTITANGVTVHNQTTGTTFDESFVNEEEITDVKYYLVHGDLHDTLNITENVGATDLGNNFGLTQLFWEYYLSGPGTNGANVALTADGKTIDATVSDGTYDFGRQKFDSNNELLDFLATLDSYDNKNVNGNYAAGTHSIDMTQTPTVVSHPHQLTGTITSPYTLFRITADGQVVHTQNSGTSFDVNFENDEEITDVDYYLVHGDLHDTINSTEMVGATDLGNNFGLTQLFWEYFLSGPGTNGANVRLQADGKTINAAVSGGTFDFGRQRFDSDSEFLNFLATLNGYDNKQIAQSYSAGTHSIDMTQTPTVVSYPHQVAGTITSPYSLFRITANGSEVHSQTSGSSFDVSFENEEVTTDVNYYLVHGDLHDTINITEDVGVTDLGNSFGLTQLFWEYYLSGPGTNGANVRLSTDEGIHNKTVTSGTYNFGRLLLDSNNEFLDFLATRSDYDDKSVSGNYDAGTHSIDMTQSLTNYPHQVAGTINGPYTQFIITADGTVVHTQTTGTSFDESFQNTEATTDVNYYLVHGDLHDTINVTEMVGATDLNNSFELTQLFWEYYLSGPGTNGANVQLTADGKTLNRTVSSGTFDFGRQRLDSNNELLDFLATLNDYENKNVSGNYATGTHSIDMTQTPVSNEMYATIVGVVDGNGTTTLPNSFIRYTLQDDPSQVYETTAIDGSYMIANVAIDEQNEKFIVEIIRDDIAPYSKIKEVDEGFQQINLYPRILDFVYVQGKLIDMASGAGLANKPVKLENASGTVLASTTTDANGNYLLPAVDENQTLYMSYGGGSHKAIIDGEMQIQNATQPDDTLQTVNIAVPGQSYNGTSYTAFQAREMAPSSPNIDAADGSQDVWLNMTQSLKDLFYLQKTTGDGIFGTLNLHEVATEQTYDGWNIKYQGNNTTNYRTGTSQGITVIVGGDIQISGGEESFIKEIYGRTHGFGNVTSRSSFMNPDPAMPNSLDVALYKLITKNVERMFSTNTAEHQIRYYLQDDFE